VPRRKNSAELYEILRRISEEKDRGAPPPPPRWIAFFTGLFSPEPSAAEAPRFRSSGRGSKSAAASTGLPAIPPSAPRPEDDLSRRAAASRWHAAIDRGRRSEDVAGFRAILSPGRRPAQAAVDAVSTGAGGGGELKLRPAAPGSDGAEAYEEPLVAAAPLARVRERPDAALPPAPAKPVPFSQPSGLGSDSTAAGGASSGAGGASGGVGSGGGSGAAEPPGREAPAEPPGAGSENVVRVSGPWCIPAPARNPKSPKPEVIISGGREESRRPEEAAEASIDGEGAAPERPEEPSPEPPAPARPKGRRARKLASAPPRAAAPPSWPPSPPPEPALERLPPDAPERHELPHAADVAAAEAFEAPRESPTLDFVPLPAAAAAELRSPVPAPAAMAAPAPVRPEPPEPRSGREPQRPAAKSALEAPGVEAVELRLKQSTVAFLKRCLRLGKPYRARSGWFGRMAETVVGDEMVRGFQRPLEVRVGTLLVSALFLAVSVVIAVVYLQRETGAPAIPGADLAWQPSPISEIPPAGDAGAALPAEVGSGPAGGAAAGAGDPSAPAGIEIFASLPEVLRPDPRPMPVIRNVESTSDSAPPASPGADRALPPPPSAASPSSFVAIPSQEIPEGRWTVQVHADMPDDVASVLAAYLAREFGFSDIFREPMRPRRQVQATHYRIYVGLYEARTEADRAVELIKKGYNRQTIQPLLADRNAPLTLRDAFAHNRLKDLSHLERFVIPRT
jgi:hypothetical protein